MNQVNVDLYVEIEKSFKTKIAMTETNLTLTNAIKTAHHQSRAGSVKEGTIPLLLYVKVLVETVLLLAPKFVMMGMKSTQMNVLMIVRLILTNLLSRLSNLYQLL